jgi:hypothetical protein
MNDHFKHDPDPAHGSPDHDPAFAERVAAVMAKAATLSEADAKTTTVQKMLAVLIAGLEREGNPAFDRVDGDALIKGVITRLKWKANSPEATALRNRLKHERGDSRAKDKDEPGPLPDGASTAGCRPGYGFAAHSPEEIAARAAQGDAAPALGTIFYGDRPVCDDLMVLARFEADRTEKARRPMLLLASRRSDGQTYMMDFEEALAMDPRKGVPALINGLGIQIHSPNKAAVLDVIYPATHVATGTFVERTGWTDAGATAFALTGSVVGSTARPVRSLAQGADRVEGTLEQWRSETASIANRNRPVIFAIATMALSPFLALTRARPNVIFHFYGPAKTGKTAAAEIAGSVWGPGPEDPNPFMLSWHATPASLEGLLKARSGIGIVLDEIKSLRADLAWQQAYLIGHGHSKGRMTREIKPRETPSWSLTGLSTGEISLREHAGQSRYKGESLDAGAETRLISIPVRTVFPELHGFASLAELRQALQFEAHGVAGRALIEGLVSHRAAYLATFEHGRECFLHHCPGRDAVNPEAKAVIESFADVAGAGAALAHMLHLPWSPVAATNPAVVVDHRPLIWGSTSAPVNAVIEATYTMMAAWLETAGGPLASDTTATLENLRGWIAINLGAFGRGKSATHPEDNHRTLWGWLVGDEPVLRPTSPVTFVEILPASLKGAFQDTDVTKLMQALRDQGLLVSGQDRKRLQFQRRDPRAGEGTLIRVYRIRAEALGWGKTDQDADAELEAGTG